MEPIQVGCVTVYPFGLMMAMYSLIAIIGTSNRMNANGLKKGTASWFGILAVPLCFIFARILYCLCIIDQIIGYDDYGFIFRVSDGGFMVWGSILGGILAGILTGRITRQSAWTILDSSVVWACLLIAFGRVICGILMKDQGTGLALEDWFNTEWTDPEEAEFANRFSLFALEDFSFFERLPFAVQNSYETWCWAIFIPEALWAVITAICVNRYKAVNGGKTLLFITMYSSGQILFESMLKGEVAYLPWLGFVKANQILCAVALLIVTVICIRGMHKKDLLKESIRTAIQFIPAVLIIIAMEFAVFEKKITLIFYWPADVCHLIMTGACTWLGITVFRLIRKRQKLF